MKIDFKKLALKSLLYFIIFVLIVALFDKVIMPFYTKHGKEYELPDVSEMPLSEAIDVLKEDGFDPVVKESVYDANYGPGMIIRQNPSPFTMVKKGRRIYLVVSIGEKPVYMPNLIGLTPKDAEFRLKEETLTLNRVIYEFSEFYPNGVVINQSTPAGNNVDRNQGVNITVSLGTPPSKQELPSLVGKSYVRVRKELEVIGVKKITTRLQYRPDLVPGTVVRQSVSAGTPLEKIESIDLVISTDRPLKKPEDENSKSG
jgi:serine/threonine-protein kinase